MLQGYALVETSSICAFASIFNYTILLFVWTPSSCHSFWALRPSISYHSTFSSLALYPLVCHDYVFLIKVNTARCSTSCPCSLLHSGLCHFLRPQCQGDHKTNRQADSFVTGGCRCMQYTGVVASEIRYKAMYGPGYNPVVA